MTDIAQLREALARILDNFQMSSEVGIPIARESEWEIAFKAAEKYLTLREAGALIITPDEDGAFPAWAVEEALMWKMGQRPDGLFNALRDAMPPEEVGK